MSDSEGKKIKITLGSDSCTGKTDFSGYKAQISGTKTAFYKLPNAKQIVKTIGTHTKKQK